MNSCSLLTLAIKNELPTYNKKNNCINSPKKILHKLILIYMNTV